MPPCAHAAHLQSEPIPEFVFARAQDPAAKSEQANRCLTYAAAALYYLQGQSCGIIGQFVSAFFLPLLSTNCLPSSDAYMKVWSTRRTLSSVSGEPLLYPFKWKPFFPGDTRLSREDALVRRWHQGCVPWWRRLTTLNADHYLL